MIYPFHGGNTGSNPVGDAMPFAPNKSCWSSLSFQAYRASLDHPRLYLAERVAAVIEVKSDIAKQWDEIKSTSNALRPLQRQFKVPGFTPYGPPPKEVPLFAVGYTGWKDIETVKHKVDEGIVDGILVIDKGLFATRSGFSNGACLEGSVALWGTSN